MRRLLLLISTLIAPAALHAQTPVPLDTMHVAAGSRVIAGAAAVTRSVDVFDRAAIDALPARSVLDVIARALGADLLSRSPAQADLSLRGGSFEQVLVLVDGVPVNDAQTGHFHLDIAVPLESVERIEVLRGPASAVYGTSAVGGVVNIVTRRDAPGVTARAEGGTFRSWLVGADAAFGAGGVETRIGASHDASDGHRSGTEHRITQLRGSVAAPLFAGTLDVGAAWSARDFGAAEFYAPFDSREDTRTLTGSVGWLSRPGALTLGSRIAFRQHDDDFILVRSDPSIYRNLHTTRQTRGEMVGRWQARTSVAIALGAEGVRDVIESRTLGDRTEQVGAVFAEAGLGDAARALLTVGARLDDHSTFDTHFSASAAASWQLSRNVRLRASAANGFRAPSWTDRYYEDPANIGSPTLRPERFVTAEAGAAITAGVLSLDAAAFVRRARDLIDWGRPAGEPDSVPWRTLNVEDATFRGLEASARIGVSRATVTVRTAILSVDAEESEGFVSKYALQPLTRSASAEVALPIHTSASGALRAAAFRRADGESWQTVDLRAGTRLFGLDFFADVTNLLDDEWLDVSAMPAPGRAFRAGVRVRR